MSDQYSIMNELSAEEVTAPYKPEEVDGLALPVLVEYLWSYITQITYEGHRVLYRNRGGSHWKVV